MQEKLENTVYVLSNLNGIFFTDLDADANAVVSNNQFRIATAIYPSASMMNHSCDPTVINSFFNKRLIVR